MSIPTQPTTTLISTEALKRFLNGGTPLTADITRSETYGFEKVKRDIMNLGRKWRPIIATGYDILAQAISHYSNPSDFECPYTLSLMRGDHTGTLSAVGGAGSVSLAVDEDITAANARGRWLLITSGTGIDQAQQISAYNATSKIATMAESYSTTPVTGDGYMVVSEIKDLRYKHPKLYDRYDHPGSPGTPTIYTSLKNSSTGQFAVYPVPDGTYGIRHRYYADLMRLDTSSTLYNTILRRWAAVLEQGVFVWKLSEDDDRYSQEAQAYSIMLQMLASNDLDGQPTIQGKPVTGSTKAT